MRVPVRFLVALALALEVVATVVVAQQIGGAWTLVWLAGSFLLGLLVMRRAGSQAFAALRRTTDPTAGPGPVAGDTVLLFVAGLLLAVPGFLTDVIGVVLLVPPIRHVVRLWIVRAANRRFPTIRSTFTTVRLADGSVVIPGEVIEDDRSDPDDPAGPQRPDEPPALT